MTHGLAAEVHWPLLHRDMFIDHGELLPVLTRELLRAKVPICTILTDRT